MVGRTPYWIQVFDPPLSVTTCEAWRRHIVICLDLICKESASSRRLQWACLQALLPSIHIPGARSWHGWPGMSLIPGSRDVSFIMLALPDTTSRLWLCISSSRRTLAVTLPGHLPWSPAWYLCTYALPPPSTHTQSQRNLFKRHICFCASTLLKFHQPFPFLVDRTRHFQCDLEYCMICLCLPFQPHPETVLQSDWLLFVLTHNPSSRIFTAYSLFLPSWCVLIDLFSFFVYVKHSICWASKRRLKSDLIWESVEPQNSRIRHISRRKCQISPASGQLRSELYIAFGCSVTQTTDGVVKVWGWNPVEILLQSEWGAENGDS